MCISVLEGADMMEAAIRAADPEAVCMRARVLKQACIEAKEVLNQAWTEEVKARVKQVFEQALEALTKPDPVNAAVCDDISQFSWCRVYSRFRDLFPDDSEKYAPYATSCPIIVKRFVDAAAAQRGAAVV